MGFREYFLAKQGFIVKTKQRTVIKTLSNGKQISKQEKYTSLVKVLPQAIKQRTITLPEVDHIEFSAFNDVKSEYFSKIILPKSLKRIDQKSHVYPFFYMQKGISVDVAEGNTHFFKIGQNLYANLDSKLESTNKLERDKAILNPRHVELILSECQRKTISVTQNQPSTGGTCLNGATAIKINNGAFKHTPIETLSVELLDNQTLEVNGARDENFGFYNFPDTLEVNGKVVSPAQFLANHARMLIEVTNSGGTIMVKHIDSVDYVGRFMNSDEITQSLEDWLGKLEKERKEADFISRRNNRGRK